MAGERGVQRDHRDRVSRRKRVPDSRTHPCRVSRGETTGVSRVVGVKKGMINKYRLKCTLFVC